MEQKDNIKKLVFKILNILLVSFCVISLTIFTITLFKLKVLPLKYMIILYVILIGALTSLILVNIKIKKVSLKIIILLIFILYSVGLLFINEYLSKTYDFLTDIQADNYEYLTYSVIVNSTSDYKTLEDLTGKKIMYMSDEHTEYLESSINIDYEKSPDNHLWRITESLRDNKTDAIILESAHLNLAEEEIDYFKDISRIIQTIDVLVPVTQEIKEANISVEPFILYISGIDKYGPISSTRSRSDVNQLVVVNPKTSKILLINTPRDYYVTLHGKNSKDKLTHAGIYGINTSIKTMENLYAIDINYYLRVNFNTLINVVDVIGGLDIYSDKSFTAWTNKTVHIDEGWNHLNGEQALAYARERYAYASGDRHRGENQQQVISAIIEKATTKEVLINNYSLILNTLLGTFQTDMSIDTITNFLRYQLDKMPSWEVEAISVTGRDSRNYTYSMGSNYLLYVMEPDTNSVNTAKAKIKEVLNEN